MMRWGSICKKCLILEAIWKSCSPWASTVVVLVRKKDGSLRFCVDLRKLNAKTIKDAHSLPQIKESLDFLNGACIFTSLDLKKWILASNAWQREYILSLPSLWALLGSMSACKCLWIDKCASHFPEINGVLFGGPTFMLVPHLFGWCNYILKDTSWTCQSLQGNLWKTLPGWTQSLSPVNVTSSKLGSATWDM